MITFGDVRFLDGPRRWEAARHGRITHSVVAYSTPSAAYHLMPFAYLVATF